MGNGKKEMRIPQDQFWLSGKISNQQKRYFSGSMFFLVKNGKVLDFLFILIFLSFILTII